VEQTASRDDSEFTHATHVPADVEKKAGGGNTATWSSGFKAKAPRFPRFITCFAQAGNDAALARLSHEIMRGPSPLSPGLRELIAAFHVEGKSCPF